MAEMRIPPHLFARGGVWYVKKVVRGERRRESTGVKVLGEKELKLAIRRQKEIEDGWDTEARGWQAAQVPTFGEWWQTYYATYTAKKVKGEIADRPIVNQVLPKWKRLLLTQITKSMCERHLQSRAKDLCSGSVNRERGLLQAIFQRAIEEGLLERNPFMGIERGKNNVRTRVVTREEQTKLNAVLNPELQRWLVVMLGTGLRIQECRALTVGDLDRVHRTIAVGDAAKYSKHRSVPLFLSVEEAIDAQQAAKGRLWRASSQRYWQVLSVAAKTAEIPHISPHALRHSFGTRYIQAGGDIFVLSKIMGHASVQVTEKQYVHLVKTDLVARSLGLDLGLTEPQPGGSPKIGPSPINHTKYTAISTFGESTMEVKA